jgi:hypothetical protein
MTPQETLDYIIESYLRELYFFSKKYNYSVAACRSGIKQFEIQGIYPGNIIYIHPNDKGGRPIVIYHSYKIER